MMQKRLYFICPTDHLECIINDTFGHSNYYYTSLGNSVVFDQATTQRIRRLIKKHNIKDISFVLSNNNPILLNALGDKDFSEIKGLKKFYTEITTQKKRLEVSWQSYNHRFTIFSYYLNKKIRELQVGLNCLSIDQINLSGKIYNAQKNSFHDIYPDLICRECFSLN